MRDIAHGAFAALLAYAAWKLAGHALWSAAAIAAYFPVYLGLRDRFPARTGRGRAAGRT